MASPPYSPFPISGHVYERDLSTVIGYGTVKITNKTKDTWIATDIKSNGEYIDDLANLKSGWDSSDKIKIEIFSGDRYGYCTKTIESTDTEWEVDLDADYVSPFNPILDDQGKDYTIHSIAVSIDTNGHSTKTSTNYIISAIIHQLDGRSDEVKAGVMNLGDIIAIVSGNDINKKYMLHNNEIVLNGANYKIINIVKEPGVNGELYTHYEVQASRLN